MGRVLSYFVAVAVLFLLGTASLQAEADGEALCETLKKLPLPEGLTEMGFSVEEGSCVYRYQFGQAPEDVLKFFEKALAEQNWKILSRSGGSVGIGQGYTLEAVKDNLHLSISAGQAFMMKVLELRLTTNGASSSEVESIKEDKNLKKIMESLPVPEGAGRMGETVEPRQIEVTYQYGGDLRAAANWIEEQLKKQGWKITRKEMNQMAGIEGGTLEANKDGYHLEVSLASAFIMKTIVYKLRPSS